MFSILNAGGDKKVQYKIRELRINAGYTQEELAQKSGVNRTTISAMENGNEVNVSVKLLKKLAECLHVKITDVFC